VYARSVRQYYAAEIEADFAAHLVGTLIGAIGAAVLLTLAVASNYTAVRWSILAYSVGLMTMLGFSAAYHVQRSSERRDLLRRLDHAAIFVMIAGTYTPLYRLHLGWRLRDLAHQVDVACSSAGVAVKLAYPRRSEWPRA